MCFSGRAVVDVLEIREHRYCCDRASIVAQDFGFLKHWKKFDKSIKPHNDRIAYATTNVKENHGPILALQHNPL
jgi:hypothetical protein